MATGVTAIAVVMSVYAGLLLGLTVRLQDGLGFTPLRAGLTFAAYAGGFAAAALTWPRLAPARRSRLPVIGPVVMAAGVLAVGGLAAEGGWPAGPASVALAVAGAGHAWAFSPLAHRLTAEVPPAWAGDVSGLILVAGLLGQVAGVTVLAGIEVAAVPAGSAPAFAHLAWATAVVLAAATGCAVRVVRTRARAT